jgi:hypothetical protein
MYKLKNLKDIAEMIIKLKLKKILPISIVPKMKTGYGSVTNVNTGAYGLCAPCYELLL